MKGLIPAILVIGVLFTLIIMGGGVLVWLSSVAEDHLTPAQNTLIITADWMIKACAGGILGFAAGLRLANGKAVGNPSG